HAELLALHSFPTRRSSDLPARRGGHRLCLRAVGGGDDGGGGVIVIASCAGLTRASIHLQKSLSKRMDCQVKPGNDDHFIARSPSDRKSTRLNSSHSQTSYA